MEPTEAQFLAQIIQICGGLEIAMWWTRWLQACLSSLEHCDLDVVIALIRHALSTRPSLLMAAPGGPGGSREDHNDSCFICLDASDTSPVAHCRKCFAVAHRNCLERWLRTHRRCPVCTEPFSLDTRCFCGRSPLALLPPQINNNGSSGSSAAPLPGSCGEICNRPLRSCEHRCRAVCHPGVCPPCDVPVRVACVCGEKTFLATCAQAKRPPRCETVCPRLLPCCGAVCARPCHKQCPPCEREVLACCHCGKQKGVRRRCGEETTFSCGGECGKALECKQHTCKERCHPGPCPPCPRSPALLAFCACGKTPIAKLIANASSSFSSAAAAVSSVAASSVANVSTQQLPQPSLSSPPPPPPLSSPSSSSNLAFSPNSSLPPSLHRKSCTDPMPTCNETCNKLLSCGKHSCERKCHEGDCGPCLKPVPVPCRCGRTTIPVSCSQVSEFAGAAAAAPQHQLELLCDRVCMRVLSCGKHRCSTRCCERTAAQHSDSTCTAQCGQELECGHRCTAECHRGPCPPCSVVLRGNITCRCGRKWEEELAFCGELSAEEGCGSPCLKEKECRHPCRSLCHAGPCPPCYELVTKRCACGQTELKNQPCSRKLVLCGKVCNRPLPCGSHFCTRRCHTGPCDQPSVSPSPLSSPSSSLSSSSSFAFRSPISSPLSSPNGRNSILSPPMRLESKGTEIATTAAARVGNGSRASSFSVLPSSPSPSSPSSAIATATIATTAAAALLNNSSSSSSAASQLCTRPCNGTRRDCGHKCVLRCHGATDCPINHPCQETVIDSCPCGRRKRARKCGEKVRERREEEGEGKGKAEEDKRPSLDNGTVVPTSLPSSSLSPSSLSSPALNGSVSASISSSSSSSPSSSILSASLPEPTTTAAAKERGTNVVVVSAANLEEEEEEEAKEKESKEEGVAEQQQQQQREKRQSERERKEREEEETKREGTANGQEQKEEKNRAATAEEEEEEEEERQQQQQQQPVLLEPLECNAQCKAVERSAAFLKSLAGDGPSPSLLPYPRSLLSTLVGPRNQLSFVVKLENTIHAFVRDTLQMEGKVRRRATLAERLTDPVRFDFALHLATFANLTLEYEEETSLCYLCFDGDLDVATPVLVPQSLLPSTLARRFGSQLAPGARLLSDVTFAEQWPEDQRILVRFNEAERSNEMRVLHLRKWFSGHQCVFSWLSPNEAAVLFLDSDTAYHAYDDLLKNWANTLKSFTEFITPPDGWTPLPSSDAEAQQQQQQQQRERLPPSEKRRRWLVSAPPAPLPKPFYERLTLANSFDVLRGT